MDNTVKWVNSEPGVLELQGTKWRIVYNPGPDPEQPYRLYRGEQFVNKSPAIFHLKILVHGRQSDLEEIGAV